ncbi:MAG TPA: hypothetical protein VD816_05620, partial [Ohtaekwangia sp.]|nr:hypothetical protein [Ohtaekwangia sp.]
MRRILFFFILSCISFFAAGQSFNYVNGTLDITINAFNPCGANPAINNGYIEITINAADGGGSTLIFLDGPGGNDTFNQSISQGSTFTFNASQTLPDGVYQFIIRDNAGNFTINTFADPLAYPPIILTDITSPALSEDIRTNNTSCFTPTGQIQSSIAGGSQALPGGGSYSYTWTADNGLAGLPLSATTDGTTPLNLAALLGLPGLPGGSYTLFVKDNYSVCSDTRSFTITDPSPVVQNVTTPSPLSICAGDNITITLNASENAPVNYEIVRNGVPSGISFPGTGVGPFVMTFPSAIFADNDIILVRATNGFCSPVIMNGTVTLDINPLPTITGVSINPVCSGETTTDLVYTSTTGSPNQYSIDFDGAAQAAGFADVINAALTASPLAITVPGAAAPGTYNATITVRNTVTGCGSTSVPVSIVINANPTITVGPDPSVCIGSTTANLTYSATTGAPNQYSIDFNGAAEAAGFVDVASAVLPASPIVITVPGTATPGTYSGTLTVINTLTGCPSGTTPISVTINTTPTITLGANPAVCAGSSLANLSYSATTGSPDQFSVDYNAAAEAQGFTDIVNAALPASPIGLAVPGGAADGVYNATITVRNSVTGCVSGASPLTITVNPGPTITLGSNPAVCIGSTTADLTYSATTNSPNQYSIDFNAAAEAQGFADITNAALPANPIVINIPGAAVAGTYNATIVVHNTVTGCSSAPANISVTLNADPTITLGPSPSVCVGSTTANLAYTATTGSPDRYSINFDAAAEAAGFTDVSNVVLPASPIAITVPGAGAPGTYNAMLTVTNSVLGCGSASMPITITINAVPTITLGVNPAVCQGTTVANLTYTAITGSPNEYSIDFNAAAEAQGFVDVVNAPLPASPIVIAVPPGASPVLYSYVVTVRNSVTGCVSANTAKQLRVNPNPTITLGPNPSICQGSTTANLTYTTTTGAPNRYSIDFDAAAEAAGFTDIVSAVLPVSPISIAIPGGAGPGTYNANLSVLRTTTTCSSVLSPITISIVAEPTITPGLNPTVCAGATAANLPYSATSGSPDQFSIDFNAAAEAQGFVDVVNAALPASPIVITVPGGAVAGVYNATLTVRNSGAGCTGSAQPVSVTVDPAPAITPGSNPSVCLGSLSANLSYTATGTPDRYNLDFDAAAEAAGFTDITNTPLSASPIVITIPGAATAGTYTATLTVSNTVTGCSGSSLPVTVTLVPAPTITLGLSPSVCTGSASANLTYTATTGSPDQFSIDFDAAAEAVGFADIVNAPLTTSPIVIAVPGAATAGTYNGTITVHNTTAGCSSTATAVSVIVTDTPTITIGPNPTVCSGSITANLTYSATTGAADQYSLDFNAAAEAAGFADIVNAPITASPLVIVVPGAAPNGTYSASLTVRNSAAGCSSSASVVSVTILSNPSITLGPNPSVCVGSTTADIGYTSTAGAPDQFSLDFDAAAEAAGFADITNAPLPASPIVVNIPGAAVAGVYNASIIVSNSGAGCSSGPSPVTITIDDAATITLGANPSVCSGDTLADLAYTSVTGGVDLYSINFDAAAEAQGFADVVDVAFTGSPLQISVPASTAGIFNGVITVRNSASGCFSAGDAFTVEILDVPSITPGPDPVVCVGMTFGDLTYAAATGSPDQYSIDFNAAAEAQGFVDITNAALPVSPIQIAIPGGATAGIYDAVLT